MQEFDLYNLFFNREGRIARLTWWGCAMLLLILYYVLPIPIGMAMGVPWQAHFDASPVTPEFLLANAVVALALLHSTIAIYIKRLHDIGRTARWTIMLIVPYLAFLGFQGAGFEIDELVEFPLFRYMAVVWLLIDLWLLIELGFRRGTAGASKYGPDPLEGSEKG